MVAIPKGEQIGLAERGLGSRTLAVKDLVLQALRELDGVTWLKKLADEEPAAFASLVRALIPRQLEAEMAHSGEISFSWKGESSGKA